MTSTPADLLDFPLERFADAAATAGDRKAALTQLITAKILPKYANDPRSIAGRQLLLSQALYAIEPQDRLLAIAESVRLGQVVKRWAPDIIKSLSAAFECELPQIDLLPDADDRLNLARACRQMSADWLVPYVARSIVFEETGEKARTELITALFDKVSTLSDGVGRLVYAFGEFRPRTEAPGDTVAKRIIRILASLRDVLLDTELDTGDGLGKTFYNLVSGPLSSVGKPQEEKVQIDLSREVLLTLHDIVRTRISVIADPEMYRVVDYCRKLCGGGSWPHELAKPLDRLIADVTEALVLLGRQGMRDQALLAQLEVLCNHPERARVVSRNLASRHPELPDAVRDWLEHGRLRNIRSASDAAVETAASNADEGLGVALQAARKARLMRDVLINPLISSLEIYEPALLEQTQNLLDQIQTVAVLVEQVAGQRAVDLYGTVGDEIEMSPKFFTVISDTPRQRMIVKQPAVVKRREDGSIGSVVIKGLVE